MDITRSRHDCFKPENPAVHEAVGELESEPIPFHWLRHTASPQLMYATGRIARQTATILPAVLTEFITANLSRPEIEDTTQRLIDHLDATDAPFEDLEPEEDCCEAFDDLGGLRVEDLQPRLFVDVLPGDPEDAETDLPVSARNSPPAA